MYNAQETLLAQSGVEDKISAFTQTEQTEMVEISTQTAEREDSAVFAKLCPLKQWIGRRIS